MLDFGALQTLSHSLSWPEYYAWHIAGFLVAYFSLSAISFLFIRDVLIKRKLGFYIDNRPIKAGQIGHEIRKSMSAMLFLSFFAVLALKLEEHGMLTILWKDFSLVRALGDLLLFAAWNELYFFSCHWLLHRPFLFRRVHSVHHYSVTTTPFSSLSFHWFEALLYSGTMILIMLVHDFDILAIMLWPAISMTANTFGHANFSWPTHTQGASFLENNWRHGTHHRKATRNFGFWTPWLDRWLASGYRRRAHSPAE